MLRNSYVLVSFRLLLTVCIGGLAGSACQGPPEGQELGMVSLHIAEVPEDVTCMRVTAAGVHRTEVQEVQVVPGQAVSQTLVGMPLGQVEVFGEAFGRSCDSVTSRSVADWVSVPETVSIVPGSASKLLMQMKRNGRLKVELDFAPEPACTDTGGACSRSAECCSSSCQSGMCAVAGG